MKIKYLFILFCFGFLFLSCVINPYYIIEYKTDLPKPEMLPKIDKVKFKEYFIDDVYIYVRCTSTSYYPKKIRKTSPFRIRFMGATKEDKYSKIIINSVRITSNLGNNYIFDTPTHGLFENWEIRCTDKTLCMITSAPYGETMNSFDFDYANNEIITLEANISLENQQGELKTKDFVFKIYPVKTKKYIDFIVDPI